MSIIIIIIIIIIVITIIIIIIMKNWVGIEGGKVRRNVPCVGMSVRM